jgi:hypothetical protein
MCGPSHGPSVCGVSTTLVPPSYYMVQPCGGRAQLHRTIANAATALSLYHSASTAADVYAVTGTRQRSLTESELRELGRQVRAWRLVSSHKAAA